MTMMEWLSRIADDWMANGLDAAREMELHWFLCLSLLIFGLVSFLMLFVLQAPYGRYQTNASSMWGPLIPAKVAWFVQESPTLILSAYLVFFSNNNPAAVNSLPNQLLISYFVFHYVNRTIIYPLRIRGGKPTPFTVFFLAFLFCSINAYLQIRDLTYFRVYPKDWIWDIRFVVGSVLFFVGWYINYSSDEILRGLRKGSEGGYKIPRGGMFEYVSGANFFGEILEWFGFAMACNSFASLVFAIDTFCNIAPRGYAHHKFYLQKFKDEYPRLRRRAVIPFIW